MAFVTEKWSEHQFQRGVSAVKVFQISEVENEDEAAANVPFQRNNTHPWDSRLFAQEPAITRPGFTLFEARVQFIRPTLDSPPTPDEDDPLLAPLRILWQHGLTTEAVDIDADGGAILNSAGDKFDPPPTDDFDTWHLTITRNEQFYDPGLAEAFFNKINEDQFQGIAVGKVRCISIIPESEYTEDAAYVPVQYRFEIRVDGHRFRILDHGYNGRTETAAHLAFYEKLEDSKIGDKVSQPVLLDGAGQPLEDKYYVGKDGGSSAPYLPPGWSATVAGSVEGGNGAKFLIFPRKKSVSFAPLGLPSIRRA